MFTTIVGALGLALLLSMFSDPSHGHEGVHHDGCTAEDAIVGDIVISDGFSRATLPAAPVAAGYLTITNNGAAADRLVAAASAVTPTVEIHDMVTEDGMMKMLHLVDGIVIPPGESVALAPGGKHIMFIGPNQPFIEGDCVAVTLSFEQAGEVPVMLQVGSTGARGPEDGHGHDDGHGHEAPDDHAGHGAHAH